MRAEIALAPVMRQITIDVVVTGVTAARFRLWLGAKIIALAALVMGCNVDVDIRR